MEKAPYPVALYLRITAALAALVLVGAAAAPAYGTWTIFVECEPFGLLVDAGRRLNRGDFYPPLEADGHYAGTRHMPLFFCLVAGAERLLGDYLLAAKLVALAAMLALVAAAVAVVRRLTGRGRMLILGA